MNKWGRCSASEALALCASPIFALMAVMTAASGGGPMAEMCSNAHGAAWLAGMLPMYVLMSAFHLPIWLSRLRLGKHSRSSAML